MNFTFENQGTNTYLVYNIKPEDQIDTLSLGMLTNNNILGFAQAQYVQMDNDKYIKYNVSAHISVKQFFSGIVNRKRLIGVFNGIVDAMLSADEYMIDSKCVLLDLEYMFTDVSTSETVLICLPISNEELGDRDLGQFFKNIMFNITPDQGENCDYFARIINHLNTNPHLSLGDFKKLLEELDEGKTVQLGVPQNDPVQPAVPVAPQPKKHEIKIISSEKPVIPNGPSSNNGFDVPGSLSNISRDVKVTPQTQLSSEQKISFWYLMQHYNSENAKIYKAQKEAKKQGKNASKNSSKAPKKSKKQEPAFADEFGFVAPGHEAGINQQILPNQNVVSNALRNDNPSVNFPGKSAVSDKYGQQITPRGQTTNFGETTVLGGSGSGETTVLGAGGGSQPKPHLIRAKNNEKVWINKPDFRIGKEKSYVDYFIADNSSISRSHANIVSRNGEYYIIDTNSTNHTYVNGVMIQSNVEAQITDRTKITLGNEEFEFRLY